MHAEPFGKTFKNEAFLQFVGVDWGKEFWNPSSIFRLCSSSLYVRSHTCSLGEEEQPIVRDEMVLQLYEVVGLVECPNRRNSVHSLAETRINWAACDRLQPLQLTCRRNVVALQKVVYDGNRGQHEHKPRSGNRDHCQDTKVRESARSDLHTHAAWYIGRISGDYRMLDLKQGSVNSNIWGCYRGWRGGQGAEGACLYEGLGEDGVHDFGVAGEAVDDAAGGVGVEERDG